MIVRSQPSALGLLFIMRGSIVPMILPRILAVVAMAALVTAAHAVSPTRLPDVTMQPFTLLGLALSIFLGFRNNACYERWWEGRKQLGQLLAEVRALLRDFSVALPDDAVLRRRMAHRLVAFAHALRGQLRGTEADDLAAWLAPSDAERAAGCRSKPDIILLALAEDLRLLIGRHDLSDILYQTISDRLLAMTTIQTACERLHNTPMPFTYRLLLHRTAWLFCLLLPFGMVGSAGLATPILVAILAYAFFGLDQLGEELEEPFGITQNALPLDALVRAIEIAGAEALGDAEVPLPLQPTDYVLL
jgi:putative membrane protein